MSARLSIPATLNLYNNAAERGAWLMSPEKVLVHLARWPLFHRRVWEAVVQCCNGAIEQRRRKRAAQFQGKLASIYGQTYSLENIQRAVADFIAWGFLVPVAGSTHAHSGRVYLLAGLDFQPPEGAAYLEERPPFRSRFKAHRARFNGEKTPTGTNGAVCAPTFQQIAQGGIKNPCQPTIGEPPTVGRGPEGWEPGNLSTLKGSPGSLTADPPSSAGASLPIPGDLHKGGSLPIPGDPDKARPISSARPTPQPPRARNSQGRAARRQKRRGGGGAKFDQLVQAFRKSHGRRGSKLSPGTISRALANAREEHPELNDSQICDRLAALAPHVPEHAKHPILWASRADWDQVLAERPKAREFSAPAPAPVKLTADELARQQADLVRLGFAEASSAPKGNHEKTGGDFFMVEAEGAAEVAERQRILASLDRYDRAAWLSAQLAALG